MRAPFEYWIVATNRDEIVIEVIITMDTFMMELWHLNEQLFHSLITSLR
jgi:hypothetical protein